MVAQKVDDSMKNAFEAKTMSAEEARREWRYLVDAAIAGEDVIVKRYSRPAVAIIAYEDYAAIRQELEEMRAQRRSEQVRAAWQQGKIKALPWDEAETARVASDNTEQPAT
jgi:prevent-host-death family protein